MASPKLYQPWIPFEKVESIVQIEPALFVLGLALTVWITSKLFFKKLSGDRRSSLILDAQNLKYHTGVGILLFGAFNGIDLLATDGSFFHRLLAYLGLITILSRATIFVKACRILAFEYFFIRHRNVAFPVLLVNLITLLLCVLLTTWIGTEIFSIQLGPVLATSAVLSLVLGLALQDTLGNLFAGVTLQFDKPYEIGNWIEVSNQGQTWIGEVYEISWRSISLIAFTEELIIVPNRVMAQAKISNYTVNGRPIMRTHVFKLPFGVDIEKVKYILLSTAQSIATVRKTPPIEVFISETTESWVGFKLMYFIDQYGRHFRIADQVYTKCLAVLKAEGFKLATHRVSIEKDEVNIS